MEKNYLPIGVLFQNLAFDDKYKCCQVQIDKFQKYIRHIDESRIFAWEESSEDEKVHISKCFFSGYGENFSRYKNFLQLVVEEENAHKAMSMNYRIKKNNEVVSENVRIYQQYGSVTIKVIDIQITGECFVEGGKMLTKGIFEVIDLNEEVVVYQKMISKYVHDLKNQITMLLNTANNIQNSAENHEIKQYAHFMKDTLHSSNYMLSFMNMEKRIQGRNKLFNTHHVINALLDTFKCESDIEFKKSFKAANPRLYADKGLITNVIYNVLINAIQAMEHCGCVSIKTYNKRRNPSTDYKCELWIFIEVCDEGKGVSKSMQNQIFDSYFTTKQEGSGLGLYSSKITLSHHNGTINVKSKKGRGAVFTIGLPSHIE